MPSVTNTLTVAAGRMKATDSEPHCFSCGSVRKEQLDSIKAFYNKVDKDDLKDTEKKFKTILEEIRVEMDKGTPSSDAKVRGLAEKWSIMLRSITINDSDIWKQGERFHAENPDNELQFGMDSKTYQYIQEALK